MQPDPATGPGEPMLNDPRPVAACIIEKDLDTAALRELPLDGTKQFNRTFGIDAFDEQHLRVA